jgi:secreted trypsin-like serine protease
VLALVCCALTTSAIGTSTLAAPPNTIDAPTPSPLIAHGELAVTCAWPTAVSVAGGGQCSGTLIHPQVVVYAAHCGGSSKTISFGEDALAPARSVTAGDCRAYPDYAGADDQTHDWAYCVLDEAITDLPVAPPLFGCETAELEVGREVALVGFGADVDDISGIKRWAATTLVAVTPANNTTLVGNPSLADVPSICSGDSGGPAFVQLDDGSWRTFGIASTVVGPCGGYGAHSMLSGAVAWIESDSGIDITPCHATDQSWAPGPACASTYAHAAGLGSGSWPDWCSGTTTSDRLRSCGPAWDEFDAKLPPSVDIESPSWGESFLENIQVEVSVAAVKHADGYAVARVHLQVDGAIVATDEVDPWGFTVTSASGPGVYELVAIAEDWAGNEVTSAPVEIGFGVQVPDPDSGTSTDESGGGPALDAGGSGCACNVIGRGSVSRGIPILLLIMLVMALRLLQRRRARATMRRDRNHDGDALCPLQNQALVVAGVARSARDRAARDLSGR